MVMRATRFTDIWPQVILFRSPLLNRPLVSSVRKSRQAVGVRTWICSTQGDERNKPQRQTVTNTHRPTTPASPLAITKATRVLQLFYLRWKRVCGVSQRVSWAQGVICTEQKPLFSWQKLYESETWFHLLSFQGLSKGFQSKQYLKVVLDTVLT